MTRSLQVRVGLVSLVCLAAVAVTQTANAHPQAGLSNSTRNLQELAQQQTKLMLKFYKGQNVSPPKCGQGQSAHGFRGVFLLPVVSFAPGDKTLYCNTRARRVLLDLGGFAITEDNRLDSSYPLNGQDVPFTRENLEPICDDVIAQGFLPAPAPATLDGHTSITGTVLNSGVFTARVNPHGQIPGGADLYGDSVALGHPGRLATVFCGFKAKVHLGPGKHTIVADYSGEFSEHDPSTVRTYNIKVKGDHRTH